MKLSPLHHNLEREERGWDTCWFHSVQHEPAFKPKNEPCALWTQSTPWLSMKDTDCDECWQSGMDDNHTNALWQHSQPCMACCTPDFTQCTTNGQVEKWEMKHSGPCALWVVIHEATVVNHHTSKRTHWQCIDTSYSLKPHCSICDWEKKERHMVWNGVWCCVPPHRSEMATL